MPTRRGFLAGLAAATAFPAPTWADAGGPSYLTAARGPDGADRLVGLDGFGAVVFEIPLPARGHAAAAHPARPEAVAFARRPGTYAVVLDCRDGSVLRTLTAPANRHFYGHGAFSTDGALMFTTENDLDTMTGRIGVWETGQYTRVGDFASGGIGPHDVKHLPGTGTLAVANGGLMTHPDSGRAILNLPTMAPNLAFLALDGTPIETHDLPAEWRMNSLRHLDLRDDGLLAAALQWQGDAATAPPLLALGRLGEGLRFPDPSDLFRRMQGYAGSVAFSGDGARVGITSPRGGQLAVFDAGTLELVDEIPASDVCGLCGDGGDGFAWTTGLGVFSGDATPGRRGDLAFDNHLIPVGRGGAGPG
ncbi:DUF1513 domain-containing protein [Rhodobacterales bacterium HKCCE2091]|nr:DUF1513 domain-containing protein [Rhodobacterales bacterium HKCCE2091]